VGPPKIALLFLVVDKLPFADLWKAFLEGNEERYTLRVHAKNVTAAREKLPSFFRAALLPMAAQSIWCRVHGPMFALVASALEDASVSKFVFVSSDSIPVKPFPAFVRAVLAAPTASLFCVDDRMKTAELWSVLSRKHGALLVQHREILEDVYGRFRSCTDESMFYWPLMDTMPSADVLSKACPMWTEWPDYKHGSRAENKKVAPTLVKATWAKIEEGGAMHPTLFSRPPAAGLRELLEAPGFLMARKFAADATVPGGGGINGQAEELGEVPLGVFMRKLLLST